MDSNIEVVRGIILARYQGRLEAIEPGHRKKIQNALAGISSRAKKPLPAYTVTNIKGEAHNQEFTVSCEVAGINQPVVGKGISRVAEQAAAELAPEQLSND